MDRVTPPPTPPKGYVLGAEHGMKEVLAVEAELLQSEGIDPEWPGFAEGSTQDKPNR